LMRLTRCSTTNMEFGDMIISHCCALEGAVVLLDENLLFVSLLSSL